MTQENFLQNSNPHFGVYIKNQLSQSFGSSQETRSEPKPLFDKIVLTNFYFHFTKEQEILLRSDSEEQTLEKILNYYKALLSSLGPQDPLASKELIKSLSDRDEVFFSFNLWKWRNVDEKPRKFSKLKYKLTMKTILLQLYLIKESLKNLMNDSRIKKREIYYQSKDYLRSQDQIDQAVILLCLELQTPRRSLKIVT